MSYRNLPEKKTHLEPVQNTFCFRVQSIGAGMKYFVCFSSPINGDLLQSLA